MTVFEVVYVWNWDLIVQHLAQFIGGAWVDVWVSAISFLLASVIGLAIALLGTSGSSLLRIPSFAYIQVARGLPEYVLLLWVYFGLSQVVGVNLTALQAVVVALTVVGSGYTAEIFRAGIQSVDTGQAEAAQSLGLNTASMYRDVILPQTLRVIVPPLGNTLVGLLKGATIMSVIAAPDMVLLAQDLDYRYFAPFEVYLTVGAILVVLVSVLGLAISVIERGLKQP